jgi:CRISPR-associated protein Cas2
MIIQYFLFNNIILRGVITMMVLVTYDVNTSDVGGAKRLRKVAKCCVDMGQRVQNSVFECLVTPAEFEMLKFRLNEIIDIEKDSIRYYFLGKNYQSKMEHIGAKTTYEIDGILIV